MVAVDFALVLLSLRLAVGLRFSEEVTPDRYCGAPLLTLACALAVVNLAIYQLGGLYRKVWRYAGVHELASISLAVSMAYLPFVGVSVLTGGVWFSRGILVTSWAFTLLLVGAVRFSLRLASEPMVMPTMVGGHKVLIVGNNDSGEATLRELRRHPGQQYEVVGFVSVATADLGLRIRGTAVLGTVSDIPCLVQKHAVDQIILAQPSPKVVREVVTACANLRVELKTVPSLQDVVEGKSTVQTIREVSIEDLLERPPVRHDLEDVRPLVQGRCILVTGAGGSIGSEICRQLVRLDPGRLVLLGRGENSIHEIAIELRSRSTTPLVSIIADVRDEARMMRIFAEHKPDLVFHAAAHKHVPFMEDHPDEAFRVNVLGTRNCIRAAQAHGVQRMVLLSTDKAVDPVSVMGASKRLAEQLILNAAQISSSTRFAAVRFGNVLGSRGSVIPTFRRQIALGGPVTVTHADMTRFFMTIPEAVTLVLEAAAHCEGGELFMLDMGEPVRILDLARNLIRLSGFEPDLDIEILITGARPGEKLDEVLLGAEETATPTSLPKIRRVLSNHSPGRLSTAEGLEACLNDLTVLAEQGLQTRLRDSILELYAPREVST